MWCRTFIRSGADIPAHFRTRRKYCLLLAFFTVNVGIPPQRALKCYAQQLDTGYKWNKLTICLYLWDGRSRPADLELHGRAFVNIERHIVSSCIHTMSSMMSWSVDGRVEETEQDSPAVISSTYFHLLAVEEATWLAITRKTTSPTLVPCRTPQDVSVQAEKVAPTFTHCCLSDRKLPTQLSRAGWRFIERSFSNTTVISTLSKAFAVVLLSAG